MSLLIAIAFFSGTVDEVREYYGTAVAAYREQDPVAMQAATTRLVELRPDSPNLLYLHAAASAMGEDPQSALGVLERLASMGLSLRAAQEAAFDSLSENAIFLALIERFEENALTQESIATVATGDDGHFIPEQVIVDPESGDVLVGSVRKRTIVRMNETENPVFAAPGACGLMSVFGMKLDSTARELWVATTGAKEAPDTPDDQIGDAGVVVLDADTGNCKASYRLPDEGSPHWLGDLILHEGGALATDSINGRIWRLDDERHWSVVLESGRLSSPQGLVANKNGDAVFVADYSGGLWRLDMATGNLSYVEPAADMNTFGIDGLYRHGEWLIAVQNGHRPHRVAAFRLAADEKSLTEQRILASGHDVFDDPTLGDIRDGHFYFVANSHWPSFDAEKNLPPEKELSDPLIVRVALDL